VALCVLYALCGKESIDYYLSRMRISRCLGPVILVFILNIWFYDLQAQKPPVRNLVFEGSGMRGIAYCGVLMELEEKGLMGGIEKVGGTSAGALMALTVSLGYNSEEIKEIIGSTNFKKLNDGRFFLFGGIHRMRKKYGWYRGEKLNKLISKILIQKTGNDNISFYELKKKGYKDLYVTGTSLNRQSVIVFSHENYPSMKVKDAVRISMTIPLYFSAVLIDSAGVVQPGPQQDHQLDVMVDGGFTANFPIKLFDGDTINPYTLGFRIDTKDQIDRDLKDRKLVAKPVNNFNEFMAAFYTMVMENLNRQPLTPADWQRTISIDDGNVSPRIRKLSQKEISILIDNGRNAMKSYLN
jgi:NTE family protein